MSRNAAVARTLSYLESGAFYGDLARRIAIPTESQNPQRDYELGHYLDEEMKPALEALGFRCRVMNHPKSRAPFLYGDRIEGSGLPTVLGYAHGDVIRGLETHWKHGCSPWQLAKDDAAYYGRGVADNKGQHTINLAALAAVLAERGRLGFNAKWLIEMGEETGSAGLRELCADNRELFAADVLIASDGPRLSAERPTIFLGSRGAYPIDLWINARDESHHSGTWGGLLSNPAIELAHAISTIVGPKGQVRVPEWRPADIPAALRRTLAECDMLAEPGDPVIDPNWGEPGLSPLEKVVAWCTFEILAMTAGTPENPINVVPSRAWARGQLRFVTGIEPEKILPALRHHLDRHGFSNVEIAKGADEVFRPSRLDIDHPWVKWAAESILRTTGKRAAVVPSLGGSLPNDVFSEGLGLPTLWVPHSHRGCLQHAPNEYLPISIAREALQLMAGLYWDLGELGAPIDGKRIEQVQVPPQRTVSKTF
jgi:acetylornithine deacetylase/succinyl-diaminopimelate desuccinylase-like protein